MDQPIVAASDDTRAPLARKTQPLRQDADGIPKGLPVGSWWSEIERIASNQIAWKDWPKPHQELVRMTLRFTRSNGSTAFEPAEPRPERLALLRTFVDPGLATISRWWSGTSGRSIKAGPPPLPAYGSDSQPIASLRADWAKQGDFLAVDARDPAAANIELTIGGLPLLGPAWLGANGKAKMKVWNTSSMADVAEWSVGSGDSQAVRTAVLLRGRKIAVLAEERNDKSPGQRSFEIGVAEDVTCKSVPDCASLIAKSGTKGVAARVVPIPVIGSAGSFQLQGRTLSMNFDGPAGRYWTPLLVSWDPDRNRRPLKWRKLTVSENGKACKPGVAFAARVSWGLGDGLVIYHSLGKPASRTFLGHQTFARFLIGSFNQDGNVTPLLSLD